MSDLPYRIRPKNEATGMRVVSQYVQEFWECGWQPFDARNDKGIDGIILMKRKSSDLGVKVNIQVKCGSGYISSENEKEIKISIDDEKELINHIEYWNKQIDPAILIYVNPFVHILDSNGQIKKDEKGKIIWKENRLNPKAWWVDLKSDVLRVSGTKTLISIPKKNTFGEHSKGSFLKLIRPLLSNSHLPEIIVDPKSKNLLNSIKLKEDARKFFKEWKNGNIIHCKALNKDIRVTKTAWNHILSSRRGKERRVNSLKLLGIAKQIIEEVEADKYFLLNQKEYSFEIEQKFGIRARYNDKMLGEQVVQVIIMRKLNKLNRKEKLWFYSVHYRR
ncbi:DUF4365 domain-containing protein [Elizabethkingia meningoseptica]|uniref:DUF4365 domain-containing protein n=1 Tax=Elizabethkingia meningoseptica TaxID=238 RepID=UPI0020129C75|nr:DUF4365 domain-containing protein [Elizabethkingia meningoseptica]MCL1675168.1 DUF4365 domain-containing protein [Elizabethkingia meningoseptica]MCL1685464.1 DUF4365 domain-containing protein [Elizabethkingia meningoseptica]